MMISVALDDVVAFRAFICISSDGTMLQQVWQYILDYVPRRLPYSGVYGIIRSAKYQLFLSTKFLL